MPTGQEDALIEGFPGYLREATFGWIFEALGSSISYGLMDPSVFIEFQNAMRKDFGFRSEAWPSWEEQILPMLREVDDDFYLNFLDYLVQCRECYGSWSGHPLEEILSGGGSAWSVHPFEGGWRLVQRVPKAVRHAVCEAVNGPGEASRQLGAAWVYAYGANPRPSEAYSKAVVAVEIAALSCIKVEPKNGTEPTLSSLFSILEAENPKWKLVFRDNEKAPGAKSLATMLRALWRGHESRHGRPEYTDASIEEARAAVMLAATLVQWFSTGVVRRVEED